MTDEDRKRDAYRASLEEIEKCFKEQQDRVEAAYRERHHRIKSLMRDLQEAHRDKVDAERDKDFLSAASAQERIWKITNELSQLSKKDAP